MIQFILKEHTHTHTVMRTFSKGLERTRQIGNSDYLCGGKVKYGKRLGCRKLLPFTH